MNGRRHPTGVGLPSLAVLATVWGVAVVAAMAGPVNENSGPVVRLPPLAEAIQPGQGEGTWRYCGEIPGSPAVASGDFDKALRGQGWSLRQSMTMGRTGTPGGERPLTVWAQGDWRLLLLMWPADPGRSGFALGVLDEGKLAEDIVRPPALSLGGKSGYIDFSNAAPPAPVGPAPDDHGKGPWKP